MVQRTAHPADVPAAEQQAPVHTPGVDGRTHFPSENALRFRASGRKSGQSAGCFALYRRATALGEFYELHPGSAGDAAKDLKNDLTRPRKPPPCAIPGFTPTEDLRIASPRPPKDSQAKGGGGHVAPAPQGCRQ